MGVTISVTWEWALYLCVGVGRIGRLSAGLLPSLAKRLAPFSHPPITPSSLSPLRYSFLILSLKTNILFPFDTFMNAAYGTTTTQNFLADVPQPQLEEHIIPTFFCRALYDYQSRDASSLSFRRNDIIEVLTRLESGWWDGLLGDERGWFPSNYVDVITDQEAEQALVPAQDPPPQPPSIVDDSIVDIAGSMATALSSSANDDWLPNGADYTNIQHRPNGHSNPNGSAGATQHNDFWVPQVSSTLR